MNKPAVALAATAVVFAGLGAYLLHRIDAERTRATELDARLPADEPAPLVEPAGAAPPAAGPAPAAVDARPAPAAADARTPAPVTDEDRKARQRRQAADYLAKYADPAGRAELRESALDFVRRSTADLDRKMNLSTEQYERLVQLLAAQAMEKRASAARCVVDPMCLSPSLDNTSFTAQDQDIRDIIGDEGLRELRAFRAAETERRTVNGLQTRLPEGYGLTQVQADDLTRALYDEDRRQQHEMYQRQQHQTGFGLPDGPALKYADDAPTPELALQSGEAYVQAMRDRAATQLTGEQLVAFNRMYDDLLVAFRRHLRQKPASNTPAGDSTP